jgi:flagellar FliJ protein
MKPFKLQAVLDYRQTLSNIAQQELCRTLEEEKDLIAILKKERQELDNLYADFAQRQQSGITVHELVLYENRCAHQFNSIEFLEKRLATIRRKVAAQRQTLCETDRDKKLLERLKEKQMDAYNLMLHRREVSQQDEIAIQKHAR